MLFFGSGGLPVHPSLKQSATLSGTGTGGKTRWTPGRSALAAATVRPNSGRGSVGGEPGCVTGGLGGAPSGEALRGLMMAPGDEMRRAPPPPPTPALTPTQPLLF